MAVFPDRIVQKNSTGSTGEVLNAIDPVVGASPIIGGELVVQRANGAAQILTLDSNNSPVIVGVSGAGTSAPPTILLNFEEDGTDTPYEYVGSGPYPLGAPARFGSKAFTHAADTNSPRRNPLRILAPDCPVLGRDAWTLNFWFKSDFDADFYTESAEGLNANLPKSLIVLSNTDYLFGPGAFTVTIDGGTADTGGVGTETSRTADLAKGALVFGLGGMYGDTESTDPLIPSTGEILTSANTSVCDDDWHYVTLQHEGGGVYSCFIDGDLKERNVLSEPINYSDTGTYGIPQPSGIEIGGTAVINANDPFPGTEYNGFVGSIDGLTMYAGIPLALGLREFAVPTAAPDDSRQSRPLNTLRSLFDTDIDTVPNNGDTIVYNSVEQAWENAPAPAFDVSGNNLGDIGDVTIAATASIADGEVIYWDAPNSQWINKPLALTDTDIVFSTLAAGDVIRYDGLNGIWQTGKLSYFDLSGAPSSLSDLSNDLTIDVYQIGQLGDVAVTSPVQGQVLAYEATTNAWVNVAQPPANISTNILSDLGDVIAFGAGGTGTLSSGVGAIYLSWDSINQRWQPDQALFADLIDRPTHLHDLYVGTLDLIDLNNRTSFLNQADLGGLNLSVIGDVDYSVAPLEGQMLIYRSGLWISEYGPPANLTNNLIADLSDVSRTGPTNFDPLLQEVLTFEDAGVIALDDSYQATNIDYKLYYDRGLYGIGLSAIRPSDETGSHIIASRTGGVDLRSDINFFRLRGNPDVTTNRPELRFESGDSFASPATGNFISLKMPGVILEDQTYYLPQQDGDVGDVLSTDGFGALTWISRTANNDLGQLNDVDLATQVPVDGSSLVYNATASMWVPGASAVDLSTTTLDELADVFYYGTTPATGATLIWSGSAWVPGNVTVTTALDDLTDVNYANGSLGVSGLDEISFTSSDTPSGITRKVYSDSDYGQALASYLNSNITGSFIYAHEAKGIELRTKADIIRLSGENTETDNQPELRWESGDATQTTATGKYIGLKMPANVTVNQTYTLPLLDGNAGQALVTDGAGALSWAEAGGDEASPAIVWTVDALGILSFSFTGSGFTSAAQNPDLYVTRGQKYTFDKVTTSAHPFELRDGTNTQYTAGVIGLQPVSGVGTLEWVVPMDAPDELFYQCTAHPQMRGNIYVIGASTDLSASNVEELANVSAITPSVGQALVWDGLSWTPGNVVGGGTGTGAAISQSVTEGQTTGISGELTFVGLGTSGTIVSIAADAAAWVTIYSSTALRTADTSRAVTDNPAQGSGVLAEFILPASTTVLATPSTSYFNSGLPVEEIYALVRDASTGLRMDGVTVTLRAFAVSGYTAVSGGTFGSG